MTPVRNALRHALLTRLVTRWSLSTEVRGKRKDLTPLSLGFVYVHPARPRLAFSGLAPVVRERDEVTCV